MTRADRVFARVLVALGDDPGSLVAARLSVRLAAASRGRVDACYVVERGEIDGATTPVGLREHVREDIARQGERALARVHALCRAAKVVYRGRLLYGDLGTEVAREARRLRAQVVVMATLQRGRLGAFLLGSRTQEVVSQAPCPVLLVPGRPRAAPRRGRG